MRLHPLQSMPLKSSLEYHTMYRMLAGLLQAIGRQPSMPPTIGKGGDAKFVVRVLVLYTLPLLGPWF